MLLFIIYIAKDYLYSKVHTYSQFLNKGNRERFDNRAVTSE